MSGANQTGSVLAFVLLFFLINPPPSPLTTVPNKPIGSCGSACSNSEWHLCWKEPAEAASLPLGVYQENHEREGAPCDLARQQRMKPDFQGKLFRLLSSLLPGFAPPSLASPSGCRLWPFWEPASQAWNNCYECRFKDRQQLTASIEPMDPALLLLLLLLLNHFSHVWLCATPQTAAHQAPCPWDSPGKNTGVGCHFLLQCVKVKSLSCVRPLATPWTAAYQASPCMGFSRQEYWSGVPLPSPGK